jgi:hypothetical protein
MKLRQLGSALIFWPLETLKLREGLKGEAMTVSCEKL